MHPDDFDAMTSAVQRYEPATEGGCDCCGTWAVMEPDVQGEWVRLSDVRSVLCAE